jgi:hypothetical protein
MMFATLIDRRTTLRLGLLNVAALPLESRFAYAADRIGGKRALGVASFRAAGTDARHPVAPAGSDSHGNPRKFQLARL